MRQKYLSLYLIALLVLSAAIATAQVTTSNDGVPRITLAEFKALMASASPPFVIDVRTGNDTQIRGAHHIPLGEIEARLHEIPRDRQIITYCS